MPTLDLSLYVIHWGFSAKGLPEFEAENGLSTDIFGDKTLKFRHKDAAKRYLKERYTMGEAAKIITIEEALQIRKIKKQ